MKKLHYLKVIVILLLIAVIGVTAYLSFYRTPYAISLSKHEVVHTDLPEAFNNFKVGYFSDLDLKDNDDITRLKKIVEKINAQNFDLVLFGGDIYDEQIISKDEVSQLLNQITAKYGKFAVLGEKDYTSVNDTKSILQLGGFEVLSNEARSIYYNNSSITLFGLESADNLGTLINANNSGNYKIALVHQPDFFTNTVGKDIELQLSGHSHGGYIYLPLLGPLITVDGAKAYNHGRYDVGSSTLIVSNGLGMESGQSARLFCTPDILQVTLKNK